MAEKKWNVLSRRRQAYLPWITTPVILILIVVAWRMYIAEFGISPLILPKPGAVWHAWIEMLQSPRAWFHTYMTAYETLVGFVIGAAVGVGLGILVGRFRWLEMTLNPFLIATQVIPKVAFIPLFVLWFGFGATSKIIVAAVLAFFPIMTNTLLGIRSIDPGHRDVMTSLNASTGAIFRRLEIPSAMPYILTGMEVGIVLSIIGAVVGEYLGGNEGLGYLLIARMSAFEPAGLFAVMLQLTILGFLLFLTIGVFRKLLIPWHHSTNIN